MTPFQVYCEKWKTGCGSDQCPPFHPRSKVVIARGKLPCDVLFIGEAPGESENILGRPFCGPAGQLLDRIIREAEPVPAKGQLPLRYAFTNLVGCIPRDEENRSKAAEPEDEQVAACRPRLEEFICLAAPRLIVCVGKLADTWLERGIQGSVKFDASISKCSIVHPAHIMRANMAQRPILYRRAVVALAKPLEAVGNDLARHIA